MSHITGTAKILYMPGQYIKGGPIKEIITNTLQN
jgi:hypothetical protein